jgi:glutaredoxin-like protein
MLSAMPLTPAERSTVAARLAGLAAPVRLALYTRRQGCDTCADTRAILDELAALSPRLRVEGHDAGADGAPPLDHVPAIVVLGEQDGAPVDHGIRLVGAPIGHELTSLVDAIVTVASGDAGLSEESRARLGALTRPVHVQVFSTPTCVYCPRAVALAHRLALASPLVTATAWSVIEFPDLIRRYRVTGVPKIVVDTGVELLGAQPEAAVVDAILATHA